MDLYIFVSLLFVLQIVYWMIGKRTPGNQNSYAEYFLAGRSVSLWPLVFAFLGGQVGGGLVLGSADEAYVQGGAIFLYPLGASLGLVFLGSFVSAKIAKFKIATVAEIFHSFYGSSSLQKIASLISVFSLTLILSAQIIASSKCLAAFGLTSSSFLVAAWAIVIIYTVQGGLKTVILTDAVYSLFFIFVMLSCFLFVFPHQPNVLISEISLEDPSSKMFGWFFMPLLFTFISQDMGQRCLAGKTLKIVSRASIIAGGGLMILSLIPIYFGMLANDLEEGASALMAGIGVMTNPSMAAIAGAAVFIAIISTAISIVNSIESHLANDFSFSFVHRQEMIPVAGGMTSSLCLAAIIFSFLFDRIVDLLILSYEISVSLMFVPIFFALFTNRRNWISAWASVIFGALGFGLSRIFLFPFPKEMMGILCSFVGYGAGELWVRYQVRFLPD